MGEKVTKPNINGYVATSNYFSFNKANENLTLIGGNCNITKKINVSLAIGNDCTTDFKTTKNKPAIEAKIKYNLNKNLNIQSRFREIGGSEQYRLAFGGSHGIDKNNSLYWALHGTCKDNHNEYKLNTGGWLGVSHKCKNGIIVSGEFQQNVPLNSTNKNIWQTLADFKSSDKMASVFVIIPF